MTKSTQSKKVLRTFLSDIILPTVLNITAGIGRAKSWWWSCAVKARLRPEDCVEDLDLLRTTADLSWKPSKRMPSQNNRVTMNVITRWDGFVRMLEWSDLGSGRFDHLAEKCTFDFGKWACSVHQNLQELKIDVRFFSDQSFGIVSDAFSPISPTTMNKTKWLSILFIQLSLIIFEISSLNIQLFKREVIPAIRHLRARLTGTSHTWSPNFSRSVMKIKIMFPGNYSQYHIIYIWTRNRFVFFDIQVLHFFASLLSDFRRSIRLAWIIDSSFPCIWYSDLRYIFDVPYCTVVIDIHDFLRS
jgi:hypothetical protein